MPKKPVQTPITDKEIAFAHLVMAGTMTDRRAAEAVGIDPSRAAYVKTKPRVQEYMEQHRASVRAGLVQHEVDALSQFNIGREQILAKWWEFANIDPALGYNTNSQGKALDSLWNAMGYADSDPKKPDEGEGDSKPNIYVAKWMRKPGDPDYEEDEGETAGSLETSSRREPVMSGPESSPNSAWPAGKSQPPPVGSGSDTITRALEQTERSRLRPGMGFGRFHGLGE